MWVKVVFINVFVLLLCFRSSYQLACKNERNNDVDWFVGYKLPKIDSEPSGSSLAEGIAYAYIQAPGSKWRLSTKNISSGSMLENTMKGFYPNKKELTYVFYNDDPPDNYTGTAVGHMKGVLAFDKTSGFWLIHSIPNFGDDCAYKYPENALVNGQSILCVTFKTAELNEICNQLLYSHPNVYIHHITDEISDLLDNKAKTLFTDRPSFVRKDPLTRTAVLKSKAGKVFTSFSKDNQFKEDLYSGVIAPGLRTSLMTETWRRGSGTFLPPSCKSEYTVLDVKKINMAVKSGRQNKNIEFKSTEDHSKWAISLDKGNWICVADMNRMESQENRGGGALCFVSSAVRKAYFDIIEEVDQCPV